MRPRSSTPDTRGPDGTAARRDAGGQGPGPQRAQRSRLLFGVGVMLIGIGLILIYVAFLSPFGLQIHREQDSAQGEEPGVLPDRATREVEDILEATPGGHSAQPPSAEASAAGGAAAGGEGAAPGPASQPGKEVLVQADDGESGASPPAGPPEDCDLFHGSWVPDPAGPLYTRESCNLISAHQDCRGNGRPDRGYEDYRWRPAGCRLPRFDAREFFRLMRRKTIAFVGDSVARNHMESLLCLLNEVEAPKPRGNRAVLRYSFQSHRVMVMRVWSSWLVRESYGPWATARMKGFADLHLGELGAWARHVAGADVVVLCSGHWWVKPSAYFLDGRLKGGQGWWEGNGTMELNNAAAFRVAIDTVFREVTTRPAFTGLTVFRTWSPDHYAGGAWNSGGSCASFTAPLDPARAWRNPFGEQIRAHQLAAFAAARRRGARNGARLELMDATESFELRADGHPGPYRSVNSTRHTKKGQALPQDCLHWCMPGPVDTWNEFLLEMIRRDVEAKVQ